LDDKQIITVDLFNSGKQAVLMVHPSLRMQYSKGPATTSTVKVAASSKTVTAWEASSTAVVRVASDTTEEELTSTWLAVIACMVVVGFVGIEVPAVSIELAILPSYLVARC
jgi:preprotein translocase subunit Sss1